MKTISSLTLVSLFALLCRSLVTAAASAGNLPAKAAAAPDTSSKAISWDQIGAKAGADYHGEGLTVTPTAEGARLHCVFQRLDGEATRQGLWLASTAGGAEGDRFRVMAVAVERELRNVERGASERKSVESTLYAPRSHAPRLPEAGTVAINGQTVRFSRPGLVEEYSVSLDGVRQDFVVTEKPPGAGELKVGLEVTGAKVEAMPGGAQLVLEQSGRMIAYNRLRATDAIGRELPMRLLIATSNVIQRRQS